MIISKPQTSTLFSFAAFLLISVILITFNAIAALNDPNPSWLNLTVIVLLSPLALFALYKIFLTYKVIRMGNNLIDIRLPVFRKMRKYPLDQVVYWKETVIKNSVGTYKEIEVKFQDKYTLNMGHKEYTEYPKMAAYLSQKLPKKKK